MRGGLGRDARLLALALLAVLGALALGFVRGGLAGFPAPLSTRIFYLHVPSAWVAYLAFLATAAGSVAVLAGARHAERWDRAALASAEVGLLFGAVAVASGVVWARVAFGGDYSLLRDPKLVATLVLVLAYAGYLALRRSVDGPERRARLAAVYGLLAFLAVPLSYLANRATTPHPDFARGTTLSLELWGLLGLAVLAFTLLYAALALIRYRLADLEDDLERERGES